MKRLSFLIAACLLFPSFPFPVLALGTRTIRAAEVEKSAVSLKVYPGYGLNINFIPTGEVVKRAWLDDPSRIVLSFDGCLSEGGRDCGKGNEGATVVHLRHIKTIHFENLPRSPNGGTLLTLITEGARGRKLYQFRIIPAEGTPDYTTLTIQPSLEKPASLFVTNPRNDFPPPVPSPFPPTTTAEEGRQELQESSFTTAIAPLPEETVSNLNNLSQQSEPSATTTEKKNSQTEQAEAPSHSSENQVASLKKDKAVELEAAPPEETAAVNPSETASIPDESESFPKPTAEATEVPHPIPSPVSSGGETSRSAQTPLDASIRYANDIAYGLVIASKKKHINYGTQMYQKVQSAIRLLRHGKSKEQAARSSKVPLPVLEQLIKWGQTRP